MDIPSLAQKKKLKRGTGTASPFNTRAHISLYTQKQGLLNHIYYSFNHLTAVCHFPIYSSGSTLHSLTPVSRIPIFDAANIVKCVLHYRLQLHSVCCPGSYRVTHQVTYSSIRPAVAGTHIPQQRTATYMSITVPLHSDSDIS